MAFQAIVPQSPASTSSSKKPCYDVFINHRGVDVKHKLASTIYNTLDLMGVKAFLDRDELEMGDSFPPAIEEAMRSASVHVAIFSPNYAQSAWCLEELSFMLQINVTIIPVFYHVKPSDLRYLAKGKYADAFVQHEKKGRYGLEKIAEWKNALATVSNIYCCEVDGDKCDEGKVLRKVVDSALLKMKKMLGKVATFPVALDEAVQDIENCVAASNSDNCCIVGIFGMGGSGKTTLAREWYNRKCSSMSRCSFISNVRDADSKNTLHKLQKNLLKDLRIQHSTFHDIQQGMEILDSALTSMTVLIVLDDVDNVDQMHALLPSKHNLGAGSFIIVTTREKDVLTSWGISSIYPMKPLHLSNAKKLFCSHAFLQPYSQHGFEQPVENSDKFEYLIEIFVEACHGLPLSLKVFGAMLNSKPEVYWESQLEKISRILPKEIAHCLRVSYDALDREVQQMFLDVACFFIGEKQSLVVPIWDGAGWSGEVGWDTLVNKCLVGLDKHGRINMHDHLRDLGREIAQNVLSSRIWKEEQISNQERRTQIRGIVLHGFSDLSSTQRLFAFQRSSTLEHCMDKLRPSLHALQLLAVKGNGFKEEFAALSRDLVWLRWRDFNGTNLSSRLSLAKLRVLQLKNARNLKILWQDNVELPLQLRELTIIDCPELEELPNIGQLLKLETLVIHHARNLKELWQDNMQLPLQLRELSIEGCPQLTELPNIGQLPKLETLMIYKAKNFKNLSQGNVQFALQLKELSIKDCPQLEALPGLTNLVSLRKLEFSGTGLRELPNNISQLSKLETLVIRSCNLTSLPGCLCELSNLTSLEIYQCCSLESLPEAFGRGLGMESSSGCNLKSLKHLKLVETGVRSISISDHCCPSLKTLLLFGNNDLTEIETVPRNVREIWVGACEKLKNMGGIGGLLNLQSLWVGQCPDLEIFAFGRGLGMGSPSGCNLKSLKRLDLGGTRVRSLSISDDCCPSLETLRLFGNNDLTEIETVPRNVREIRVGECQKLKSMRGIGGLLNLQSLEVRNCWDLEVLPCPVYMHSLGRYLDIIGCPRVNSERFLNYMYIN